MLNMRNIDVLNVYAIGRIGNGVRQTGVLIDRLGGRVAEFVNFGHHKLKHGVVYDLENVIHGDDTVFMDDETTLHEDVAP